MVRCFATKLSSIEGGHAIEVRLFEEIRLEPINSSFMSVLQLAPTQTVLLKVQHTLSANTPTLRCAYSQAP